MDNFYSEMRAVDQILKAGVVKYVPHADNTTRVAHYDVIFNGKNIGTIDRSIEPHTESVPRWSYTAMIDGRYAHQGYGEQTRRRALRNLITSYYRAGSRL